MEPSNSLSLSSQARLLEICNTGPGDCIDASLQLGIKMFWRSSAPLFASVHPSRFSDRSFQVMEPVVLWLYSGIVSGRCISAGMSTIMFCFYETSVICCTFGPVLLTDFPCFTVSTLSAKKMHFTHVFYTTLWLKVSQRVSHKKMFMHMSSHV